MSRMSFEEPKAPIVRIKKKKVKKKPKEKEIVHLPVRASTQARYSSLPGAQDPQSKGRECCRHLFASCFKIPICKTLCFRCILPSCYKDMESDEEEVKDEGYHSQNRGSSEVPANSSGATQGTSGSSENAVEMTEIRTETVALIPPPRKINEYRKDPCSREASNSSVDSKGNQKSTSEITYIEVESVPFTKENNQLEAAIDLEENIPDKINKDETAGNESLETTSEKEKDTKETAAGYEVPLEFRDKVVLKLDSSETEKNVSDVDNETEKIDTGLSKLDSSEYVECDNFPEKQYVNMDKIRMLETENAIKSNVHEYINDNQVSLSEKKVNEESKAVNYANIDALDKDISVLKDSASKIKEEYDFTASEEPHDYMNLSELEETKASAKEPRLITTEIRKLVKLTKSEEEPTDMKKEIKLDTDSLTNKQGSETLKGDSDDPEVHNRKESEKNSIAQQKSDVKPSEQAPNENSMKDCEFERLAVKETGESDSELDNGKDYLVHVGDSEKLVAKHPKKSKDIDKSSDESDDDSNGKKVTDQTKLI